MGLGVVTLLLAGRRCCHCLLRVMAAATCGGTLRFCSLKHGGTKEHHRYHHHNQHQHVRRRTDSRRRQAALSFLNNISLDGRRPAELANGFEHDRPEQRQQQHEAAVAVAAAAASATPNISVIAHTSRLGPVAAAAAAASGGVVASPGDPGLGPSAGEAVAQQLASGPGTPLPRSGLGTTPAVGPLGLERQRWVSGRLGGCQGGVSCLLLSASCHRDRCSLGLTERTFDTFVDVFSHATYSHHTS